MLNICARQNGGAQSLTTSDTQILGNETPGISGFSLNTKIRKIPVVDLIDQRAILRVFQFCVLTLAALQSCLCFIQRQHLAPPATHHQRSAFSLTTVPPCPSASL